MGDNLCELLGCFNISFFTFFCAKVECLISFLKRVGTPVGIFDFPGWADKAVSFLLCGHVNLQYFSMQA